MSPKVTALGMDTITKKSGHSLVPNAVSVCITPAAPSPLPIPYPVVAQTSEGITDMPMRTKINGADILTVGAVADKCHGNEPGTLREVVSLNTAGPCFLTVAAPNVYCELGMMGMTGALAFQNKQITVGAPSMATGAGGAAGAAGTGSGSGSPDANADKTKDPANSGGGGGDGTNTGASATPATPEEGVYCPDEKKRAPDDYIEYIDDQDLRNHKELIEKHATPEGKAFAKIAIDEKEGGAAKKGQAFWSGDKPGGGLEKARAAEFSVQEDAEIETVDAKTGAKKTEKVGAGKLNEIKGDLPRWEPLVDDKGQPKLGPKKEELFPEAGEGSKVTNPRLWGTISRRSAENAQGEVQAFVIGQGRPNNIFGTIELPTLLHNDKCKKIVFHAPDGDKEPMQGTVTWKRDETPPYCWRGDQVPNRNRTPGYTLDSVKGFTRKPPVPKPPKPAT